MSALITLDSVSISTPDARPLFSDLSVSIGRERIGLVGRNGSGKSSLLNVLRGLRAPSAGTAVLHASCGMLEQSPPVDGLSWAEGLGVAEDWARLGRIEAGAPCEDDLDEADWSLEARVEEALRSAGLAQRSLDDPLEASSGGQRTRLGIARLLLERPDILLLDEPTNNLDAEGRALILGLVREWPGAVVLASHDRDLLEPMDRIVELTPQACHVVTGGWSEFEAEREARRERLAAEASGARVSLDQMQKAARQRAERKARSDKQGRAARRDGSQSKLILNAMREKAQGSDARVSAASSRQLDAAQQRLSQAAEKLESVTPLRMDLPPSGLAAGQRVLALDGVSFNHGDRPVLRDVSLEISGPERVRVSGPNGAGKSTLLALAAGRLRPCSGEVRRREGEIALLDQHVDSLDPQLSLLENCRRANPQISENEARALLARFAFRNAAALKRFGALSGGERLRAGLACLLGGTRPPRLLMLDEPTNHLDLEAIEVLESALNGYDGALLITSHDRRFAERIGISREIALPRLEAAR